jgi:hypothetical protein
MRLVAAFRRALPEPKTGIIPINGALARPGKNAGRANLRGIDNFTLPTYAIY